MDVCVCVCVCVCRSDGNDFIFGFDVDLASIGSPLVAPWRLVATHESTLAFKAGGKLGILVTRPFVAIVALLATVRRKDVSSSAFSPV